MIKTSLNRATSSYQPLTKDKGKTSFPKTEQPVQPNREYTSPETLELQGYKQPKAGAMIENVMAAQLAGMSDRPSTKDEDFGNILRAPRPSKLGSMDIEPKLTVGRPPSRSVGELGNQLTAPRPSKLGSMAIQPKLTVGRPASRSVGELRNQLRAPRPSQLGSMGIQPKLTIGEPHEAIEQEADRVARRVVDEINAPASVQRQTGDEELQMKPQSSALIAHGLTGMNDIRLNSKEHRVQREGMEEGVLFRRAVVNRMDGYAGGKASKEFESANAKERVSETVGGSEAQLQAYRTQQTSSAPIQAIVAKTWNKTGLPDSLKTGIENLSGYSMDDVKVVYNSDKPAQLQAHAYAQGTDIHLASGQEKHLPHEAWHVVQQKQGRVKPTMQMKGGIIVNDDHWLEKEAEVMGKKASSVQGMHLFQDVDAYNKNPEMMRSNVQSKQVMQLVKSQAFLVQI